MEFTDEQAIKLLALIADYAEVYGNGGNPDMTVKDLVMDLVDSLDTIDEPVGHIESIRQVFPF